MKKILNKIINLAIITGLVILWIPQYAILLPLAIAWNAIMSVIWTIMNVWCAAVGKEQEYQLLTLRECYNLETPRPIQDDIKCIWNLKLIK